MAQKLQLQLHPPLSLVVAASAPAFLATLPLLLLLPSFHLSSLPLLEQLLHSLLLLLHSALAESWVKVL